MISVHTIVFLSIAGLVLGSCGEKMIPSPEINDMRAAKPFGQDMFAKNKNRNAPFEILIKAGQDLNVPTVLNLFDLKPPSHSIPTANFYAVEKIPDFEVISYTYFLIGDEVMKSLIAEGKHLAIATHFVKRDGSKYIGFLVDEVKFDAGKNIVSFPAIGVGNFQIMIFDSRVSSQTVPVSWPIGKIPGPQPAPTDLPASDVGGVTRDRSPKPDPTQASTSSDASGVDVGQVNGQCFAWGPCVNDVEACEVGDLSMTRKCSTPNTAPANPVEPAPVAEANNAGATPTPQTGQAAASSNSSQSTPPNQSIFSNNSNVGGQNAATGFDSSGFEPSSTSNSRAATPAPQATNGAPDQLSIAERALLDLAVQMNNLGTTPENMTPEERAAWEYNMSQLGAAGEFIKADGDRLAQAHTDAIARAAATGEPVRVDVAKGRAVVYPPDGSQATLLCETNGTWNECQSIEEFNGDLSRITDPAGEIAIGNNAFEVAAKYNAQASGEWTWVSTGNDRGVSFGPNGERIEKCNIGGTWQICPGTEPTNVSSGSASNSSGNTQAQVRQNEQSAAEKAKETQSWTWVDNGPGKGVSFGPNGERIEKCQVGGQWQECASSNSGGTQTSTQARSGSASSQGAKSSSSQASNNTSNSTDSNGGWGWVSKGNDRGVSLGPNGERIEKCRVNGSWGECGSSSSSSSSNRSSSSKQTRTNKTQSNSSRSSGSSRSSSGSSSSNKSSGSGDWGWESKGSDRGVSTGPSGERIEKCRVDGVWEEC